MAVVNGAPSTSSEENALSHSPYQVLGIALVVDEIGKGARLAFRYPVTPTVDNADDLFFTLPPRVMAKLFRPKKPLCGRPMTISVGGTVFCCRAILLDEESHLVLFNVIVALAPSVPTSLPIAGWFDAESKESGETSVITPSSSFLAVRRVHVSIARLCRVLEREERRCQYVSLQSAQLIRIQGEVRQAMDERRKPASTANSVDGSASEAAARRPKHRRGLSSTTAAALSLSAPSAQAESSDHHHHHHHNSNPKSQEHDQHEIEQEILELVMAAAPPAQHHGNLAQELVQVYHSLARNDHEFLPTPSILLSGNHGIVYLNRHVSVYMEAASGPSLISNARPRSYQTLLFPHASPKELVQTLSTSSAPQRLQQLLLMVNPRKALSEIAMDAALPLPVVLELAAFLVKQGACVVSSVVSRSTKLACASNAIRCMQERALDFSQEFGVSIFVAVSVLTSGGVALGEIMSAASGTPYSSNDEAALLGRTIAEELQQQQETMPSPVEVEEVVYAMAVWLRSHQVVIGTEEYLVAVNVVDDKHDTATQNLVDSNETADSWDMEAQSTLNPDEVLYKELSDCLTGNVSTVALCWKFGIEPIRLHRFRTWGVINNKLRVVTRVPSLTDDWNTSESEQQ